MVLVNQAIFEAKEGYSKKVRDLKVCIAKESFELERMTTDLGKLSTDFEYTERFLYNSTEEGHGLDAQCADVRGEKESFLAEKIRINALKQHVEDYDGSYVSMYKDSEDFEESLASRYVERFQYLGEQAKVVYPQ